MSGNEWYIIAINEIVAMIESGIEPSRDALIDELEPLCSDSDVNALFEREGGFIQYVDTLWNYMEQILYLSLERSNYDLYAPRF